MIEVLVFSHYYLPGYKAGGALRTLVNMVDQIGGDVKFKIVTLDRDLGDLNQYQNVRVNQWNEVGKALVYYQSKVFSLFKFIYLLRNTSYDVIYLNSFFDYNYSIKVLLFRIFVKSNKPIILAPRGEFSEGALKIKSTKKSFYLKIAKMSSLYKTVVWQASSKYEQEDILNTGLAQNILVVPDMSKVLTDKIPYQQGRIKEEGVFKMCFISRISRMKNLDFALRVIARLKHKVKFDIYGPKEDCEYWGECELIIKEMPCNVDVNYFGTVNHDDVVSIFGNYDLFFLPTHGENYGHVIIESMLAGTPVLISDKTQWSDLLERNVGWVHPLSSEDLFLRSINAAINKSPKEYGDLRSLVKKYAEEVNENSSIKRKNINMFLNLK